MKRAFLLIAALAFGGGLGLTVCTPFADSTRGSPPTTASPRPPSPSPSPGPGADAAPLSPPVTWCETGFTSPYRTPPTGAVTIPAGDNSNSEIVINYRIRPNTVYWFAPGVHTLGSGPYAQIQAAPGDTFVGAPGAILSGQGQNNYAVESNSTYAEAADTNVTIKYLTIEDFMAGEGAAVVGEGGYSNWRIEYNLIKDNVNGAGVLVGTNSTVTNNCLTHNGEYGFISFESRHVTLTNNEISYNDTAGCVRPPGRSQS